MPKRKKILIVDDEIKILDVVKSYLEKEEYEVNTACDGGTAMELLNSINPSLVILDLMLPDISGEDICREIRKSSDVPIIMLTAKVDETNILEGFHIGADDYVTKPFSPRQLMARVKALLRRAEDSTDTSSRMYTFSDGDLTIDVESLEVRKNGSLVNLTQTEFNLLTVMVKYPNKAFTREELVSIAIASDYDGFDRVIDTHVKNIRQKIESNPKEPQYILTVHGVGYKFCGNQYEK